MNLLDVFPRNALDHCNVIRPLAHAGSKSKKTSLI